MSYGELIREARRKFGWTQQQLADELCVHFTYVSHLESGRKRPGLTLLARLAEITGERATLNFPFGSVRL